MLKPNQATEELIEEAEAWLVKLRSEEVSHEDKVRFSSWLNTSEEHIRAFDNALELWEGMSAAACLAEPNVQNSEENSATRWVKSALNYTWFNIKSWQIAAALCLAASYSLLNYTWLSPTPSPVGTQYATTKGERRTIALQDGSSIELNTNTAVDVLYTEKERTLTLLSGEAYFSVAHDKQRPFVVHFEGGSATAVGTAFNVYRGNTDTAITVTEGIVDVREAADIAVPNPHPTRVNEAQQVKLNRRGVGPVKNVSTSRSLAWRDGTIVFRDTPLRQAIGQLNRYLEHPVNVKNSDISGLKVSGTFSLHSPSDTLDAIAEAFSLKKAASIDDELVYVNAN